MTDLDDIRELYSQLLAGWSEHVEYAIKVGGNTEKRAKTVRHPALVAELQAAATETLTVKAGGGGRGSASKAGSRPPLDLTPLALLDDVRAEAVALHDELVLAVTGVFPPLVNDKSLPVLLHNVVAMLGQVQHTKPGVVNRAHRYARRWVRQSRLALGHDQRHVMLRSSVCGGCGGALMVAPDASTDVRCVGYPDGEGGCGTVYERAHWIELWQAPDTDLVSTADAAEALDSLRPLGRDFWMRWIHQQSRVGRLTRHGSVRERRWDWEEIKKLAIDAGG